MTRPYAAAAVPSNTSPPSVVSAAARGFIRWWTVSEMIAAARPSFTSVSANVASSAATAMSAAATMPMPPARTGPATSATTGLPIVSDQPLQPHDRARALLHAAGRRLGQVGAGAEHPARGPDQHHLDAVVGLGGLEPLEQLAHQLPGQRVAVVRGVQRDGRDRVDDLEVDELGGGVGHGRNTGAWPTTRSSPTGVRDHLGATPTTEMKMFGGLAFLVGGNMAVGVSGQGGLMVRCAPEQTDAPVDDDQ